MLCQVALKTPYPQSFLHHRLLTLKLSRKLLGLFKMWNHIYYHIPKGLQMVLFSVASLKGNLVLAPQQSQEESP